MEDPKGLTHLDTWNTKKPNKKRRKRQKRKEVVISQAYSLKSLEVLKVPIEILAKDLFENYQALLLKMSKKRDAGWEPILYVDLRMRQVAPSRTK